MTIQVSEENIFLLYYSLEIKVSILVLNYNMCSLKVKSLFVTVTNHASH